MRFPLSEVIKEGDDKDGYLNIILATEKISYIYQFRDFYHIEVTKLYKMIASKFVAYLSYVKYE
ncbi:hypothetical protein CAP51_16010 [Acinetobacter populi]|uniref:Uncharacterized protein n=1 Tax=Acinetobacter populi TaxID=1582270 RepID=A0A1Z9YU32_9GAMM|nr:hypothetical protein CAP51_16010 [Acinetobacter populi]